MYKRKVNVKLSTYKRHVQFEIQRHAKDFIAHGHVSDYLQVNKEEWFEGEPHEKSYYIYIFYSHKIALVSVERQLIVCTFISFTLIFHVFRLSTVPRLELFTDRVYKYIVYTQAPYLSYRSVETHCIWTSTQWNTTTCCCAENGKLSQKSS